jgi:hypothetical protein
MPMRQFADVLAFTSASAASIAAVTFLTLLMPPTGSSIEVLTSKHTNRSSRSSSALT